MIPGLTTNSAEAEAIKESIRVPVTRSEPPRRRAPSRASTASTSSTTTRSRGLLRTKRARDDTYIISDRTTTLPEPPSSSAPEASVSEYQPSVLSRTSGNRRALTGKHRATGKENAIFKTTTKGTTVHTPGPRGKNKRILDDEVNFTKSAPLVRFTSKTGL
ncbi:hypothetical protein N7449_000033 [Penicillium cf. viridicatum]|uniref:Uncharacterized protein n=1 Tax=Penicillium cf. viridicatum TaxID=2972119 RepID=A0A9W9N451_9EURO|nr:hypothetical protein N7449_000033 [Penicillium cf. viridicatum]